MALSEAVVATGGVAGLDRRRAYLRRLRRVVREQPLAAICAAIIVLLLVIAAIGPLIAPFAYDQLDIPHRLHGPSGAHWFGTDQQGRDVFSRVLFGARTTVLVGFSATLIATTIATLIGVVSGYYGGWLDTVMQRALEVWMSFPGLIFIIFVISIAGASNLSVVITLGALFSAGSSRIVRSSVLAVRGELYITAAVTSGAGSVRIMLRHVVPNVVPIVIVIASVQIGAVVLAEAGLSFLGFGTPPPFPSWGRMLQEGQTYARRNPHLALYPGLAIALIVFSFNIVGDAIRDALDPRLRTGH